MKIGIVGLGLIGGSLAKAFAGKTEHTVYGMNRSSWVLEEAIKEGVIADVLTVERLPEMDVVMVCLHPQATVDFILEHLNLLKTGQIVTDVSGVKTAVVIALDGILHGKGIRFVGSHPMAGKEHSGYAHADARLYDGKSVIFTVTEYTDREALELLKGLATQIGFSKIVETTAEKHDRIIAYTSQLAHIISNAYVKSPTLFERDGFTAGSFQDLTRVAKLDAAMWTDLFLKNKTPLLVEIDQIAGEIGKYRDAIERGDAKTLQTLLQTGSDLKIKSKAENPSEAN